MNELNLVFSTLVVRFLTESFSFGTFSYKAVKTFCETLPSQSLDECIKMSQNNETKFVSQWIENLSKTDLFNGMDWVLDEFDSVTDGEVHAGEKSLSYFKIFLSESFWRSVAILDTEIK